MKTAVCPEQFAFYCAVTLLLLQIHRAAELDCKLTDYLPENCNMHRHRHRQRESQENVVRCKTSTLSSRFLSEPGDELARTCLSAKLKQLTIECTSDRSTAFAGVAPFGHFKNLRRLAIERCCLSELRQTDLAELTLQYLEISGTDRCGAGNNGLVIRTDAVRKHEAVKSADFFGITSQGLDAVPEGELCELSGGVNLSKNRLTGVASLNFGNTTSTNGTGPNVTRTQDCGYKIEALILSHNRIATLTDSSFSNLINLKKLNLGYNELTIIHENAFRNLGNLTTLQLEYNFINTIADQTWTRTPNLSSIRISNNNLSNINGQTFSGLTMLHQLDLRDNNLGIIHEETFDQLINLKILHLEGNSIVDVTDRMFQHLAALETLNLARNNLSIKVERTLFRNLEKLLNLNLSSNHIESVESLSSLTELKELDLGNNQISWIAGAAFLATPNIQLLVLASNKLESLSKDTFAGLEFLKTLNLQDNRLNKIDPTTFECCLKIATLTLRNNNLTSFPNLSNQKELEELYLSNNSIASLPETSLQNLERLKCLSLGNNALTTIPPTSFRANLRLKVLRLYGNSLTDTPYSLTKLQNLNELNLQNNNLTKLDFSFIPGTLKHLNVSNNQITIVNKEQSEAESLTIFDLSHNQLRDIPVQFNSLIYYYVDHNNLTTLNADFSVSPNIKLVDLRNNKQFAIKQSNLQVANRWSQTSFLLEGVALRCDCHTQWLQGINGDHRGDTQVYGKVNDLDHLWCAVPVLGSDGYQRMRLRDVKVERFVCEFVEEDGHASALVPPSNISKILSKHNCPAQCLCYANHNWTLVIAYCSRKNLTTVPRDMPTNSVVVYLDGNNIETVFRSDFDNYTGISTLYLNGSNIKTIETNVFATTRNLKFLNLSDNQIAQFQLGPSVRLPKLRELYLQHNRLDNMSNDFVTMLSSISVLRLDHNRQTRFPPFYLESNTTVKMTLSENQWFCQCTENATETVSQLDRFASRSTDRNQTLCSNLKTSNDKPVELFKFYQEFCGESSSLSLREVILPTVTLLVTVVAAILIYVYRLELQVMVYSRYEYRLFPQSADDETSPDKSFDAFVSYSQLDVTFVAEELVKRLEEGDRPFKLCLHERNFMVGGFITNTILEAIARSRRTIVVMSENFVDSNWCRFEFKAAHSRMMEDKGHRLIVLVLGDVIPENLDPEEKLYFSTNTYLKRSDRLFWEKLIFAMPKRGLTAPTPSQSTNQASSIC